MNKLTKIATASALILGLIGAAHAAPMLQIVSNAAGDPPLANAEAIGDAGGTHYPSAGNPNPVAGAGLPTAMGGWPNNFPIPGTYPPGFALDTGLPPGAGNYGISGYDGSYLSLTKAGNVTFQFMGKGDAIDHNLFQVDTGTGWQTIWDNQVAGYGTCGTTASPTVMSCLNANSSYTGYFNAGLIAFQFLNLTNPVTATNDGANNHSPDKDGLAGYFLGMDPYLASGAFTTIGSVAYAGFTDRGCTPGGPCDHDYEDLVVRITAVPEPGSILLLGIGFMSLVYGRRRMAQSV